MATENFCMSFDDRSNCNFLNFSVRYPYLRKVKKIAMNDKFAVCIGKGGQRDQAESFARKTESIIADKPGKNLTVLFDSKGISLTGYGLTYQGDFENMLHRVTNGRLQHEMLVRAAKSEKEGPRRLMPRQVWEKMPSCLQRRDTK